MTAGNRVLVVDDYATMRRIIKNFLKHIGITDIDEAVDGSSALLKLEEKEYDLVISDWNMVPMTGLQLIREIRNHSNPKIKNIPFMMVTAESKAENVIAIKEYGVSNYIIKPFTADQLKMKIISSLGYSEKIAS